MSDRVRRRRTPSLLGGAGLAAVLDAVRDHFSSATDAEVTTEANPESTSPELFAEIRGRRLHPRVSLGMQSVAPHVLAVLDRVHSPGRALAAAREARAAGFEHVNIDLIYGTPGESDDDLRRSVDAALEAGVDHVSAYALVVEDGTALAAGCAAARSRRPTTTCSRSATSCSTAGCRRPASTGTRSPTGARPGGECRHNLGYWDGGEWWGAGPGAHGYVGLDAVVECQASQRLCASTGRWAAAGGRLRGARPRCPHTEEVMLRLRLRGGLAVDGLSDR